MKERNNMVKIAYFSGTGNTEYVAKLLAKKFEAQKEKVEISRIKLRNQKFSLENTTYFIILSPIHSFDLPWPVYKWLKNVQCKETKTTIILVSAGGYISENSGAIRKIRSILKKKRCKIIYEDMVRMPLNCFSGMKEDEIRKILSELPEKVEQIFENITNNVKKEIQSTLKGRFLSKISIFEKGFSKIFSKGYIVSEKCTLCNLCIENCPTGNIYLKNNKIRFGIKCSLCLNCIYNCPEKAISQKMFPFMVIKDGYSIEKFLKTKNI